MKERRSVIIARWPILGIASPFTETVFLLIGIAFRGLVCDTSGIKPIKRRSLSLTSEQVRAARMLLRWEQKDLAEASGVSLPSIKRLETQPGELGAYDRTIQAIVRALEKAGVEFIPENGGGAGVRLAKRAKRSK